MNMVVLELEEDKHCLSPFNDVVIVRLSDLPAYEGKLVIPDTAQTGRSQTGIVAAAGQGRWLSSGVRLAMEVKEGDQVIFSRHVGEEVRIGGKDYLVMREKDILGIVSG